MAPPRHRLRQLSALVRGNNSLFGGSGNDALYGGLDSDGLGGGDGIDTLYGGAGDDQLLGQAVNDYLFGQGGNDTFIFIPGDGNDTIYDFGRRDRQQRHDRP